MSSESAHRLTNLSEVPVYMAGLFAVMLEQAEQQSAQKQAEQEAETKKLKYEAVHDPMTGAYNRRGFVEAAREMIKTTSQNEAIVTSLIDVDEFKAINDKYGHDIGDVVLISTAQGLQQASKSSIVGRWGGDEFVVMEKIPISSEDDITHMNAQITKKSMQAHIEVALSKNEDLAGLPTKQFTQSIGQTIRSGVTETDLDEMIAGADAHMYHEKRNVRRR